MPTFREGAAQRVTDYHEESGWLYAQIVYNWTSGDGRDLDTRTRIVFPVATGYVGWAQGNTQSLGSRNVIAWPSGDNTSYYGPEVALVYLGYIREALPDTQTVNIELKANWYGERLAGNTDVVVTVYSVDGTLLNGGYPTSGTGTPKSSLSFTANVASNQPANIIGSSVRTITIDLTTGAVT